MKKGSLAAACSSLGRFRVILLSIFRRNDFSFWTERRGKRKRMWVESGKKQRKSKKRLFFVRREGASFCRSGFGVETRSDSSRCLPFSEHFITRWKKKKWLKRMRAMIDFSRHAITYHTHVFAQSSKVPGEWSVGAPAV